MIKYFLGPMSKNIVDSVMEFQKENEIEIGLIPSRRQVEHDGGYVNNWTTEQFAKYTEGCFITRDHAGPGQGLLDDDGFASLKVDCRLLDMIHIDPWKKYPSFDEGLEWTANMIKYCHGINSALLFEVGTEESIRRFEADELDALLRGLEARLTAPEFKRILYCVIQSGTSLRGNLNTGVYDKDRLTNMVSVAKRFGMLSKEHNGDYLPAELIKEKFSLGLDSINIAPELGQLETSVYLDLVKKERPDLLFFYWHICYNSGKWKKWVDDSFNPWGQKEELINICGHYVLSDVNFLNNIKSNFEDVDDLVKDKIKNKLKELVYG